MNLITAVSDSLARRPDKVIACDEARQLTGAEVLQSARAVASALAAATSGQSVGVLIPGCA
jgi:hypothetical protein